ncbi:hypothetical protein POM88_012935 [Heracleum sosnowskyi]|uniref:Uncharacterized protein n=1 Tax=Heracleum sosnowskyi TaxID=360622 RepID=A0AAD8IXE7_9APIA|nr:hypothetical protein POM88_012935 [Heracleum sosnowskyi]
MCVGGTLCTILLLGAGVKSWPMQDFTVSLPTCAPSNPPPLFCLTPTCPQQLQTVNYRGRLTHHGWIEASPSLNFEYEMTCKKLCCGSSLLLLSCLQRLKWRSSTASYPSIQKIVDKGSSSCGTSGALYALIACVTGCACCLPAFIEQS